MPHVIAVPRVRGSRFLLLCGGDLRMRLSGNGAYCSRSKWVLAIHFPPVTYRKYGDDVILVINGI